MSKAYTWRRAASKMFVLKNNVPAWLTTADNLYISLHFGVIDDTTDDQTVNEVTYLGYERQPISRAAGKWALVGGSSFPYYYYVDAVTFPAPSSIPAGQEICSHIGIGLDPTGAGSRLLTGNFTESGVEFVAGEPLIIPVGKLIVAEF